MSRGPGEIEKALEAVFKDSDDELTTRQLGCLVYSSPSVFTEPRTRLRRSSIG
jgi:hypothetical protein